MWKLQHLASYKVNVIQHVILVTKTTFPANVLANNLLLKKIMVLAYITIINIQF